MLVAAVDGVVTVSRLPLAPTWFAVLTRSAVGLYAGWVTAAFFLNASTALVDQGVVEADAVAWQLVVLAVAALTLVGVLTATRGVPAYAVAGVWALLGIAVTGAGGDHPSVLVLALVGAVGVVVAAVVVRRSAPRRRLA